MSSLLRRMQRKIIRTTKDYKPRKPAFRLHADGVGYDVIHPTRGWKRICGRRVLLYI